MSRRAGRVRQTLAVGLGLLWAWLVIFAQLGGAFRAMDEPLLDYRQSLPSPVPLEDADLALIEIDHIPAKREWPWPRLDYAILLQSIQPYGPRGVVFEMLLNDRDTRYSAFDNSFARLVERLPSTVFAATALTFDEREPRPQNFDTISREGSTRYMAEYKTLRWPLDRFAGGAQVGIANLMPEANNKPRRVPLVFFYHGKISPSLALQATVRHLGADLGRSEVIIGDEIILRDPKGDVLRRIPVDKEGRLRLRYRADAPEPWHATFDDVPLYAQMAERGDEPQQSLEELRGRTVWVGRTDNKPFAPIPGVVGESAPIHVHMMAMRNILNEDFIHATPAWIIVFCYLLVGGIGGLMIVHYGKLPGMVFLGVLLWSWLDVSMLLFRAYNIDLPMTSFVVLILGMIPVAYATKQWELADESDSRADSTGAYPADRSAATH